MGIISWIILGLIAGFIASKIVNKTGSGMLMDIALGVIGAIIGGFLASFLGIGGGRNAIPLFAQHARQKCADAPVVVDNKKMRGIVGWRPRPRGSMRRVL